MKIVHLQADIREYCDKKDNLTISIEQIYILFEQIKQELKIERNEVKEIILALDATINGQTTANYIIEKLKNYQINFSSLAHGVPVGGELDYLDDGTIRAAFSARKPVL